MTHLSFASSFRNPIFFILVIIIFTMMVAAGLRTSSGTVIPTSTVTAATLDPAEPPSVEPAAAHHSLRASLAAASAGFFAPMISATKTWMFAPGGDVNSNGLVDPGDTITYTVTIANAAGGEHP